MLLTVARKTVAIKQKLRRKRVVKNAQKVAVKKIRKKHAQQTVLSLVVRSNHNKK